MRKNAMPAGRQGFTLIEILVAATIIAVLSVAGVASYTSINKRSRDAKRKSDLEQVRSALEMYRTDNLGIGYPVAADGAAWHSLSYSGVANLVPTYLPALPMDPKSTSVTPVEYKYAPLPLGSAGPYFSYCICTTLEDTTAATNTCGVTFPVWTNCNYGLKNP